MAEKEGYKRKTPGLGKKKRDIAFCGCHCHSKNPSLTTVISTSLLPLVVVCLQAFLAILLGLFTLALTASCSCLLFGKMSGDQSMPDYFSQDSGASASTPANSPANQGSGGGPAQTSNVNAASVGPANSAPQTAPPMQNVPANPAQQTAPSAQHVPTPSAAQVVPPYQHVPVQMVGRYMVPMPLPGQPGALYFDGQNVTEFLERFEEQCQEHNVDRADRFRKLPRYCETLIGNFVKTINAWIDQDWEDLVSTMKKEYEMNDMKQKLNSRHFLKVLKIRSRTEKDDLRVYSRQFRSVAVKLINQNMLNLYTCSQ